MQREQQGQRRGQGPEQREHGPVAPQPVLRHSEDPAENHRAGGLPPPAHSPATHLLQRREQLVREEQAVRILERIRAVHAETVIDHQDSAHRDKRQVSYGDRCALLVHGRCGRQHCPHQTHAGNQLFVPGETILQQRMSLARGRVHRMPRLAVRIGAGRRVMALRDTTLPISAWRERSLWRSVCGKKRDSARPLRNAAQGVPYWITTPAISAVYPRATPHCPGFAGGKHSTSLSLPIKLLQSRGARPQPNGKRVHLSWCLSVLLERRPRKRAGTISQAKPILQNCHYWVAAHAFAAGLTLCTTWYKVASKMRLDADQIAERLREFETQCRRLRLPLTIQRRVVLETVLGCDDHPTADQIVDSVKQRLPAISRTTVYRVLDLLVEMGVIRRLHHPGPATRFDGRTRRHHHLICTKCDKVIDLECVTLDRLALPDVECEGFEIDDYSVQFMGTCAACRHAKGRQPREA